MRTGQGGSVLILSKYVTLLVPDAQFDPNMRWYLNYETLGFNELFTRWTRRLLGGLWVGGQAKLYPGRLVFEPSVLDKAFGDNIQGVEVLLASVTTITHRPNLLGGTIAIIHGEKEEKFRCWGAHQFALSIKKEVEVALGQVRGLDFRELPLALIETQG
jgi:hypothetical protein